MSAIKNKLILTAAVTGGLHGKAANPNLPEQPEEQIQHAVDAWKAGASIVHLHARDKDGKGTQDNDIYRSVYEGIRAAGCDMIIQYSTGGAMGMSAEERLSAIYAEPEMASLNMGCVNYPLPDGTFTMSNNPPNEIEWYAEEMKKLNIKPEMEVYSPTMMTDVHNLINKGLIDAPYYVNFVMGMPAQGAIAATWENLVYMVSLLPPDSVWNCCCVGRPQLHITTTAMLMGGMVRIGMEDNIYYKRGQLIEANKEVVARSARLAEELQIEIATPAEAREILGMEPVIL
ncbi:MAG: 3-keto-5-aminohexanoate cleavage protein [Desulfobacterales bacterium]|jgi:3-keto-5-aminohexanoate cleavage enzyme|nr:3-keto-5-aminohexanoate cleavage protein [Desulfobacteraceae bacterium]MBT4364184.1 3-keto-5-aminohexanoate cleavage protein [Desulfobacteraceae bacterium]MBT7085978.1 3-keto-5-aminohexanoate cleavage protein [Desulfobacterales bacterium]MBT7697988.1 3-keto-5-aminohexanoate cleavage protein [Desulfobacterales bacterium]